MKTLFLFDLDGTLVSTGGAGLRALDFAFDEIYKIKNAVEFINPSGKTDPAIFREMVQLHLKRDMTGQDLKSLAATYLYYLEREMKTSPKKITLPGVDDFVRHVSVNPKIVMGLGTGNLERGARLKLEFSNLNSYFPFGGYGSDAEDRAEVLKFGLKRAEEFCGERISPESVYILGDTILDVAAARRAGFKCIAIASGGHSYDKLKESQPDFLLNVMNEGFDILEKVFL
jgi:phosphoglycolate phosphatase-like HAD superfamily hydrolase